MRLGGRATRTEPLSVTGAFWQRHSSLPVHPTRDPRLWGCCWPPALPQSSGTATGSPAALQHSPTYEHGQGGDVLGLQEGFVVQPQLLGRHRALHRGQRLQHPAGAAGRLGAARGAAPAVPPGIPVSPRCPPSPDSQQGGPQHPPSRRLRRQPRARPHGAGPGSASARGGAAPARFPPPGSSPPPKLSGSCRASEHSERFIEVKPQAKKFIEISGMSLKTFPNEPFHGSEKTTSEFQRSWKINKKKIKQQKKGQHLGK